ncbi:hypothetical protein Q0P33_14115, partial [Staphylococcus aureus]|nr:hypothetical protein [Staphylococcus aureus]
TPAASSPGPAAPITVASRASADSLSPSEVADPSAEAVVSLLFRGLVRDDEKGKSVLAVAQSIDTDDDLVFKVTLAPGWSFSNGERVTASSF